MVYSLTSEAEADLDEIAFRIARESRSFAAAEQVITVLKERFHMLSDFPKAGTAREDLGADWRGFPVDNHLILYRLDDENVLILRVVDVAGTYRHCLTPSKKQAGLFSFQKRST